MAYRDDVIALGVDHLWRFDGNVNDSVGAANGTNSGFFLTADPICEDAINSARCSNVSDTVGLTLVAPLNQAAVSRYTGGWVRISSLQLPPKSLYSEGSGGPQQFRFVLWAGNKLLLDIVNNNDIYQSFSDTELQPERTYHIVGFVNGTGDFGLYVDGVLQSITEPQDRQFLESVYTPPIGNFDFGNPSSGAAVGGESVQINGPETCNYNFWFHSDTPLTQAQIREELFEKGALPQVTITDQTGLDALANSVLPDCPLCIRVDVVGSISLVADNVTFDPLASIHVQYTGTGTLTWTNINGAAASIGSTPNGGTINFVNPATLTVADLQPNTEVRLYEAGTEIEIAGVENSGTSFSSTIQTNSVDVVIVSVEYKIKRITNVDMTAGDVTIVAAQLFDRNYRNP